MFYSLVFYSLTLRPTGNLWAAGLLFKLCSLALTKMIFFPHDLLMWDMAEMNPLQAAGLKGALLPGSRVNLVFS